MWPLVIYVLVLRAHSKVLAHGILPAPLGTGFELSGVGGGAVFGRVSAACNLAVHASANTRKLVKKTARCLTHFLRGEHVACLVRGTRPFGRFSIEPTVCTLLVFANHGMAFIKP